MTLTQVEIERIGTLQVRMILICFEFLLDSRSEEERAFLCDCGRSFERQATLYAQGRSSPGPIVTNARPGTSMHNYGLAFDVAILRNGVLRWDGIPEKLGELGERLGLEWGGRWRKPDENHFQLASITLAEAHERWPIGWAA